VIILDTNVVSEFMRANPHAGVIAWADDVPRDELWTSSTTVAEISAGIALLPAGQRKDRLVEGLQQMLALFDGRILPFGTGAALHYGAIIDSRSRAGRPISVADAQIAAIARESGAILATRNTSDFEGVGVELIDPWAVRRK